MRHSGPLASVRVHMLLVVALSGACVAEDEQDDGNLDDAGAGPVLTTPLDGAAADAEPVVKADGQAGDATTPDAGANRADASAGDAQAATGNEVPAGAHCDPVRAWSAESSGFEQEVLTLTNAARAVARSCGTASYAAVKPLTMEGRLRCAARLHSSYMATTGDFSHTESADGSTYSSRISATGYSYRAAAENIASGQQTPQQVVDGWLKSEGHCKNIMSGGLTQIGIGHAVRTVNGRATPYWTQSFATPR